MYTDNHNSDVEVLPHVYWKSILNLVFVVNCTELLRRTFLHLTPILMPNYYVIPLVLWENFAVCHVVLDGHTGYISRCIAGLLSVILLHHFHRYCFYGCLSFIGP